MKRVKDIVSEKTLNNILKKERIIPPTNLRILLMRKVIENKMKSYN